jgi:hypothetical protein
MLICWILGHRLDYDIKKPEWMALVCTRSGFVRTLQTVEMRAGGSTSNMTPPTMSKTARG